jgi:hypothetical protein
MQETIQTAPTSNNLFWIAVRRQADAAQEVFKAGIASQRVHPGIHPGPNQSIRSFAMCPFQPLKCSLWLSQANVNACHID